MSTSEIADILLEYSNVTQHSDYELIRCQNVDYMLKKFSLHELIPLDGN